MVKNINVMRLIFNTSFQMKVESHALSLSIHVSGSIQKRYILDIFYIVYYYPTLSVPKILSCGHAHICRCVCMTVNAKGIPQGSMFHMIDV